MVSELFATKPHDSKPSLFVKAGLKTVSQNSVSKSRTSSILSSREAIVVIIHRAEEEEENNIAF